LRIGIERREEERGEEGEGRFIIIIIDLGIGNCS
jgi:hypothetical protein